MDILVTRWIGLSATVRLVSEKREPLRTRFPESFLRMADSLSQWIPADTMKETELARKYGEYVYELGNGGIFAGLWRSAEMLGCGIHADLRSIPIRQETVEFCEFFDLNPYRLESFGAALIFAHDGSKMLEILEESGIPAVRIGRTTDGNDRILRNEDRVMYLTKPQPDEIKKII
ncbi:MAG: hypothetical protein IJJ50_00960 [Lachnospiraceae bacterium]|nr:hypothetical protein [Lachnospiraceae bacterium]